jgi:hypothetical protein
MARSTGPEPTALVVVPAAAVRAAGPATRQALAALAEAPWPALVAAAERGPVPIAAGSTPRRAAETRDALRRDHGVEAEVVEPGGLALAGGAIAALAASGVLVLVAIVAAALGSTAVGVVAAVAATALVAPAIVLGRRARAEGAAWRAGLATLGELDAARAAAGDAWAQLATLRRASLDPALPPTAQADLWSALDDLDARVLAAPGDARTRHELAQALDALAGRAVDDDTPTGSAASALRSARAAVSETASPPRPRSSERERP